MEDSDSAPVQADRLQLRPLDGKDLDAVVTLDRALAGHSRRNFFARRLEHAARDPGGFVTVAAERDGRVAGFALARITEGEFGATSREAVLDAIGVDPALAGQRGVGRGLIDGLVAELQGRGIGELATQVDWTERGLLGFFARSGFDLAPRIVLARASADRLPVARGAGPERDNDHSDATGDDFQSLAHDRLPVRSMTRDDLAPIIEIDRRITGRARVAYLTRKLDEAFTESAVQMSLVAEIDHRPAGFVMARVDIGEFGHAEPEAVMDTIGVDPRQSHKGIATALLSQLMANLVALRTETLRTEVGWNHFGLMRFLDRMGFGPHRRLALRRPIRG